MGMRTRMGIGMEMGKTIMRMVITLGMRNRVRRNRNKTRWEHENMVGNLNGNEYKNRNGNKVEHGLGKRRTRNGNKSE